MIHVVTECTTSTGWRTDGDGPLRIIEVIYVTPIERCGVLANLLAQQSDGDAVFADAGGTEGINVIAGIGNTDSAVVGKENWSGSQRRYDCSGRRASVYHHSPLTPLGVQTMAAPLSFII